MSRAPLTVRLESENYVLRTVTDSDDQGDWCDWINDPDTARLLNARPARLAPDDFRNYVEGFDCINNYLLGIFPKGSEKLVGVWAVYVDWPNSRFLVNVIIGAGDDRHKGGRKETSDLINRFFFEDMGLLNQYCSAVSTNDAIIGVLTSKSWKIIGRQQKPAASGAGMVEILEFSLPRDVWRSRPK